MQNPAGRGADPGGGIPNSGAMSGGCVAIAARWVAAHCSRHQFASASAKARRPADTMSAPAAGTGPAKPPACGIPKSGCGKSRACGASTAGLTALLCEPGVKGDAEVSGPFSVELARLLEHAPPLLLEWAVEAAKMLDTWTKAMLRAAQRCVESEDAEEKRTQVRAARNTPALAL